MTREEIAVDIFSKGYNCAQSVFVAFCEENGLEKDLALRLASGFGGGLRCGEVCGAVTGAVMAIGLKYGFFVEKDFDQKNFCYDKTYSFIEEFKKLNSSIICRDLLGVDIHCPTDFRKPEAQELFKKTVCPKLVASAVRILDEMY